MVKLGKNKSLVILGSLLFIAGLTLMGYKLYNYVSEKEKIDDAIEEYYEEEKLRCHGWQYGGSTYCVCFY